MPNLVRETKTPRSRLLRSHLASLAAAPRAAALLAIRAYQLTLSGLVGRQCRHLPTCSDYTAEAVRTHGLWAGGWIGLARICRCHPWGSAGFDPVPQHLDRRARWYRPWRYGSWQLAPCRHDGPHSNESDAGEAELNAGFRGRSAKDL